MRIFKSTIAIVIELIVIGLSIKWYSSTQEIEPIIVFSIALTGLVYAIISTFEKLDEPIIELHLSFDGKGKKATEPSNLTPKDSNGNYIVNISNYIGQRELFWDYKLHVMNNSNENSFSPELLINSEFKNLIFKGELDMSKPIKAGEQEIIHFRIAKKVNGTPKERRKVFSENYPHEMRLNFKPVIKFKTASGKIKYNMFHYNNEKWEMKELKKIEADYEKVKIHK